MPLDTFSMQCVICPRAADATGWCGHHRAQYGPSAGKPCPAAGARGISPEGLRAASARGGAVAAERAARETRPVKMAARIVDGERVDWVQVLGKTRRAFAGEVVGIHTPRGLYMVRLDDGRQIGGPRRLIEAQNPGAAREPIMPEREAA